MSGWQLFIRHAHRDTFARDDDNGLSERGEEQGRELVRELKSLKPVRKPTRIFSSPKVRCVQTARFLGDWAGVEIGIEEELDERGPRESEKAFFDRIAAYYRRAGAWDATAFVSHGDLLPEIARLAGLGRIDVQKAGYFWVFR